LWCPYTNLEAMLINWQLIKEIKMEWGDTYEIMGKEI
jgi:hypothetical protein